MSTHDEAPGAGVPEGRGDHTAPLSVAGRRGAVNLRCGEDRTLYRLAIQMLIAAFGEPPYGTSRELAAVEYAEEVLEVTGP